MSTSTKKPIVKKVKPKKVKAANKGRDLSKPKDEAKVQRAIAMSETRNSNDETVILQLHDG